MRKITSAIFISSSIALQREDVDIHHHSRDGKEHAVETIEDTPMPGKHIARVLDAEVTLYHRLGEVTEGAEYHHHERHAYPLPHIHEVIEVSHSHTTAYSEQCTTDRALPRLLGRDAWEQPVPSDERTYEVSPRIVSPDEDIDGKRYSIVGRLAIKACKILECQHIDKRQRQNDIHLAQHRGTEVNDRVSILDIQLLDIAIQQEYQVRSEDDERFSVRQAVEPEGEEEVTATHDYDGATDLHHPIVRQEAKKLIHRERCQQQEQSCQAERAEIGTEHLYEYDDDTC